MILKDKLKRKINALEGSIDFVEPFLATDEFEEYCDSISTCITYIKQILKNKA